MANYIKVILLVFFIQTAIFGQNSVFYKIPSTDENKVLVSGVPPYTQKTNNAYIDYMEWYFEMRLTPKEREEYTAFLIDDWKNVPQYRTNLIETEKIFNKIRLMSYLESTALRTNQKANGAVADSMRWQIDCNARPQELHNLIKYMAQQGNKETIWLTKIIEKYTTPLVTTNSYTQTFNRSHVDSLVDLLIFKANAVAGKEVIESTEDMRREMENFLVGYWNKNPEKHSEIFLWLFSNHATWGMIKHNQFSYPTSPMTPYQLKREVRNWAEQVAVWFPKLKNHSQKRIKEYQDYVSKMSAQEMAMELNLQQNQIRLDQNAATNLRNQIVKNHVVNMNAIEGLGGGREWEYKTVSAKP